MIIDINKYVDNKHKKLKEKQEERKKTIVYSLEYQYEIMKDLVDNDKVLRNQILILQRQVQDMKDVLLYHEEYMNMSLWRQAIHKIVAWFDRR